MNFWLLYINFVVGANFLESRRTIPWGPRWFFRSYKSKRRYGAPVCLLPRGCITFTHAVAFLFFKRPLCMVTDLLNRGCVWSSLEGSTVFSRYISVDMGARLAKVLHLLDATAFSFQRREVLENPLVISHIIMAKFLWVTCIALIDLMNRTIMKISF